MEILEPDYVSKFKCDGTKCNSKCCKNWTIDIDGATVSKYKHIKPNIKSKEITKHIKQVNHPQLGRIHTVILTDERNYPFLQKDCLCFIQKNYGEDYLSKTCKTYPRVNFKVSEDFIYRALSLTCPVVCNLVLNAPRDSTFNSYELPESKITAVHDMLRVDRSFMLPLLNVTNYNILRNQDLSLDERLAMVALFCESANEATNLKELADISEVFEKEVLKNAKEILSPLKLDPKKFLKEILSFIHNLFTGIGQNEISQVYVKFINGVFDVHILDDEIAGLDFDRLERIYNEKYLPAGKELSEINGLQIENYAINYLFMTGLPINADVNDFRKNIAKYLLEYKMVEFIFVCFYASMKEKWHNVAIELVAEDVSACLEHNLDIKKAINERFKDTESVLSVIPALLDV